MTPSFERYVGIDWSGAKTDDETVPLAVALAEPNAAAVLVASRRPRARGWSRSACREHLASLLTRDAPRTLVAIDMAFGFPWGADRALFGVDGWRALVVAIAAVYAETGSAMRACSRINAAHERGAPFREDRTRNDGRFYRAHGVSYFRAVESVVPQAISVWYFGSGGKVGCHTISGMYTLADLLARRDRGELAFVVWPHEGIAPPSTGHVLVECYPAMMGTRRTANDGLTGDELDALRIADWLRDTDRNAALATAFAIPELPFGRVAGVPWPDQVEFEGWMLSAG